MKEGSVKGYKIYSPFLRIFHWVMAGSIAVLFTTGLYIGNPAFSGYQGTDATFAVNYIFSMETIRFFHFSAAYLLVAALILRLYGFAINKGDRLLPKFWTKLYWEGLVDTFLHYIFLRPHHRPCLRNSLARTAYLVVYVLILLEIVTGFAMYFMINPNGLGAKLFGPFNHLFIDEYVVHLIHHYVAWAIALFVIVHVYMAVRADVMEECGEISSMITGTKFFAEEPIDLGDIADETSHRVGHREHTITG